jgi:predicted O-methyltransferase YrrM
MKLYSESNHANIQMNFDKKFRDVLLKLLLNNQVQVVVESGTYLGLGSTSYIADIIKLAELDKKISFYTIESNKLFFNQAVKNLKKYDFVYPILGQSIDLNQAIKFLENDEFLLQHNKFDDVFIDSFDPVRNYLKELKGGGVIKFFQNFFYKKKQNLIKVITENNKDKSILIVLDSAGGIGWFEFNEVIRTMEGKPFLLILDDTNHVKHFRSRNYILENPTKFQIYYDNYQYGVLICKVLV